MSEYRQEREAQELALSRRAGFKEKIPTAEEIRVYLEKGKKEPLGTTSEIHYSKEAPKVPRSIQQIDADIRAGVGPDRTDPVTAERERLEWIEAVRKISYEVKEEA